MPAYVVPMSMPRTSFRVGPENGCLEYMLVGRDDDGRGSAHSNPESRSYHLTLR